MGNFLSCFNRDSNILERKNEINNDDFFNLYFYEKCSYNEGEELNKTKINNIESIYGLNNSQHFFQIYNMKDLTRNQLLRIRELIHLFISNGKPRSSNDFNINNYMKFYPKYDPYFFINEQVLIHNQLIIYNQNQTNINNIMIYQGDINESNQRHGIGKLITPYYILIGIWKNDKFSGWGRESRCNGDVFEGRFENGLINGKGIFLDSKKNKYIGDFKNMKRWGKGKWITNKIIYEGDFYNNHIHGKGKIKFLKSGIQYIGTFQNDKIDGYGTFKWINGDKYEGEVKNGKMHGKGKYQYKNGKIFEGKFFNGQIIERKIDNNSLYKEIDKKIYESFDYNKFYRKIDMDSYTFDESKNYIKNYKIALDKNGEGKKMALNKNKTFNYKKGFNGYKNNIFISNTLINNTFNYEDIYKFQKFDPFQENSEYYNYKTENNTDFYEEELIKHNIFNDNNIDEINYPSDYNFILDNTEIDDIKKDNYQIQVNKQYKNKEYFENNKQNEFVPEYNNIINNEDDFEKMKEQNPNLLLSTYRNHGFGDNI